MFEIPPVQMMPNETDKIIRKKNYQDGCYHFGGKYYLSGEEKKTKSTFLLSFRIFPEHISRWEILYFVQYIAWNNISQKMNMGILFSFLEKVSPLN